MITLIVGDVSMQVFGEFDCCSPSIASQTGAERAQNNYTGQHSQNCFRLSFIFHRRGPDWTKHILLHIKTGGYFTNSHCWSGHQTLVCLWPSASFVLFSPRYLCERWPTILNQITNTHNKARPLKLDEIKILLNSSEFVSLNSRSFWVMAMHECINDTLIKNDRNWI